MTAQASKASINGMPFEIAMKELETIIAKLEGGEMSLEESIDAYERGELLKNRCEHLLKQAEIRVEKIRVASDGKVDGVVKLKLDEKD